MLHCDDMRVFNRATIRSEADHRAALARMEALWGSVPASAAGAELEILADLVEAYENREVSVPDSGSVGALRHLMATHGLDRAGLPEVGPQPVVNAVLNGRRRLTLHMVKALSRRFHVPADTFID